MSTSLLDRLRAVREATRTQLWPTPVAGVVLAVLAGVLVPLLDERVDDRLPRVLSDVIFGGGPDAARTVLDAIASSLITVTSLTFSLTVVTLQLASSQFSPRLLRTFTRDRFVHVTLAVFLATFTYSLTVLRTVRSTQEDGPAVVPQISVTVAFLGAVASVVCLVLFLSHLAREIRVETMLETVHADARATADRLHPRGSEAELRPVPTPPGDALLVKAEASGFLVRVDQERLSAVAADLGVTLALTRAPGSSLVAGTPLGTVWRTGSVDTGRAPSGISPQDLDRLRSAIAECVVVGVERTEAQDVAFGLRQLTDVANKALSPGVNDPTTAVHALGHVAAFLCEVADRDLGDVVCRDQDGVARLVLARPDLPDLLELAVTQPRRYGATDPLVMDRLATLLAEVAWSVTDPADRSAVRAQLRRLRDTVQAQDFDDTEQHHLATRFDDVERALTTVGDTTGTQRR